MLLDDSVEGNTENEQVDQRRCKMGSSEGSDVSFSPAHEQRGDQHS
jgi:hypothetical protein